MSCLLLACLRLGTDMNGRTSPSLCRFNRTGTCTKGINCQYEHKTCTFQSKPVRCQLLESYIVVLVTLRFVSPFFGFHSKPWRMQESQLPLWPFSQRC